MIAKKKTKENDFLDVKKPYKCWYDEKATNHQIQQTNKPITVTKSRGVSLWCNG